MKIKTFNDFLAHIRSRVPDVITLGKGCDKADVNAYVMSECDFAPDFDEYRKFGWYGGEVRYNDDTSEDTICIGHHCLVNRGEYYMWRLADMPDGWLERNDKTEILF